MERALDREQLEAALGVHAEGVLPTVEELIELIADVEIQAVMRNFTVDHGLLRTAWYLHGVASAVQAPQLYPLPRRRRAFAVSAHIFDLALNDSSRTLHDRLTLTFAAQVGYRRAEQDPNATAVYRRAVDLLRIDNVTEEIDTLALQAGVAFLGLDPGPLGRLQRGWRRQLAELASTVGVQDLTTTMFGPAEQVVLATSALLTYLRTGDTSQLEVATAALVSVMNLSAGEGDHDARWVAAHLLQIAGEMAISSIWSVLPPGTPPAVAQAFTVGSPPVLTLWPPQRELLARASKNPLDPTTSRLLLSVPTSAGKTLLAQVMICAHLATQPGDVCYVTPLRSLGREMRQALGSRMRVLRRELGTDMPDFATSSLEDLLSLLSATDGGDVEVMTPERLLHQMRRDPREVLDRFSLFIIDEAHLLAQPGRGFLLETLLSFLTEMSAARVVLLSGVLGNAASLASWVAPGESEVLYSSDWRGPRRMHALLYAEARWADAVRTNRGSRARLPIRATAPLIGKLVVRPAEGKVARLATEVIGSLAVNESADGNERQRDAAASTPNYKIVAAAASALLHAGSLLMIVSTRILASRAAQALAETLPPASSTGDLLAFLEERLGAEHPLIDCVRHGVGYHHAGLPVDVLDAIEEAVRSDQLLAVVATSTLTDGVNLPVRTVVISETNYEGQVAGARLDAPRLLNAVGRAGRAGRETEGWIVLALQKAESVADFAKLAPEAAALEARSTLLAEEALVSLADAEALVAETADAVLRLGPGSAADFAAYVWFVLSALERLEGAPTSGNVLSAVEHLLGFEQMSPDLRRRWLAFAAAVKATYDATDPARRHRWTATGTSLASAFRLEQIVERLVAEVVSAHPTEPADVVIPEELSAFRTLELLETADVFQSVLELPEAQRAWRFRTRQQGGDPVAVPLAPALAAWVDGADIADLATQMLPDITDPSWRLEQTVDAVSTAFEHYLSWVIGLVIEHANTRLIETGAPVSLRPDFAALIRYGVDTPQALALLTLGIQSRRLAHRLGRLANDRDMDVDELRQWLSELHIEGWRSELGANPREVLDLLEFTRTRRQSLLRTLLESQTGDVTVRPSPGVTVSEEPRAAELQTPDRASAELTVFVDTQPVGVIGASDHTDVLDVLASGLDVALELIGETLVFRVLG